MADNLHVKETIEHGGSYTHAPETHTYDIDHTHHHTSGESNMGSDTSVAALSALAAQGHKEGFGGGIGGLLGGVLVGALLGRGGGGLFGGSSGGAETRVELNEAVASLTQQLNDIKCESSVGALRATEDLKQTLLAVIEGNKVQAEIASVKCETAAGFSKVEDALCGMREEITRSTGLILAKADQEERLALVERLRLAEVKIEENKLATMFREAHDKVSQSVKVIVNDRINSIPAPITLPAGVTGSTPLTLDSLLAILPGLLGSAGTGIKDVVKVSQTA